MNLHAAFAAADKSGVCVLLDPEDIQYADSKSMFTQISTYHRAFGKLTPTDRGRQMWNAAIPC